MGCRVIPPEGALAEGVRLGLGLVAEGALALVFPPRLLAAGVRVLGDGLGIRADGVLDPGVLAEGALAEGLRFGAAAEGALALGAPPLPVWARAEGVRPDAVRFGTAADGDRVREVRGPSVPVDGVRPEALAEGVRSRPPAEGGGAEAPALGEGLPLRRSEGRATPPRSFLPAPLEGLATPLPVRELPEGRATPPWEGLAPVAGEGRATVPPGRATAPPGRLLTEGRPVAEAASPLVVGRAATPAPRPTWGEVDRSGRATAAGAEVLPLGFAVRVPALATARPGDSLKVVVRYPPPGVATRITRWAGTT